MFEDIKQHIPFEIDDYIAVKTGGNSQIFKLLSNNKNYALKLYPENDERKRLETETKAFEFLSANKISQVPKIITKNNEKKFAIFEWFEGEHISKPTDGDIRNLASFFIKLQEHKYKADTILPAADACFSGQMVCDYFYKRLARFEDITEIKSFITDIKKLATNFVTNAKKIKHIDDNCQVLSPSDYGFHNAIKTKDGLKFIDFEYFGFDDPVKAISDVMLHPAMNLSKPHQSLYFKLITENLIDNDTQIIKRFNVLFPLYGLIWCLIVLNIYLPYYEKVRQGKQDKIEQLEKARMLYERVKENDF
jgi:thiamine kinase-like enzyme